MNHMSKQKLSRVIVIIIICNLLLWHNAEFSASLRQSSVSHDPSEIILICWFAAQETFIIIIMLKGVVIIHVFVENVTIFFFYFFRIPYRIERLSLGIL